MSLDIRPATRDDAALLARMNKIVHSIHVAQHPDFFHEADEHALEELFAGWLAADSFRAFIAIDSGQPIGYVTTWIVRREPNALMNALAFVSIDQIAVVEERRRQGVGRALVEMAKDLARQEGLGQVQVDVWSTNTAAKAAYEALGFQTFNEKMRLDLDAG